MEEQNKEIQSRKNLETDWYSFLSESLMRIQSRNMLMQEGCESMQEFIQCDYRQWGAVFPQVQIKNQSMLISEIRIFLSNVKPIIKSDKHQDLVKKINCCSNFIEKETTAPDGKKLMLFSTGHHKGSKVIYLEDKFYIAADNISKIIEELIELLSPILFSKDKLNQTRGEV